jgi:hypothetical protein
MRSTSRSAQARNRRTPVRAAGGGRNIPWVPIALVAGVALVIGVIVYLVIQSGKAGDDLSEWAAVEKENGTSTTLPGEGVDLQTIYEGQYGGGEGMSNTADHVTRDMNYEEEQGLPPVGGPHWGSGSCGQHLADSGAFCGPVQWGIYRPPDYWELESLVHSMEHGGIVVWYNTTNQQVIDELEANVQQRLEDEELIVLTPTQELDSDTVAVTAWGRRDVMPVADYTQERLDDFIDTMKCRFNPETMPGAGC